MVHSSRRSKGRRLQVTLAERIAIIHDLTVEAAKPTKPGVHKSGAVYVSEGQSPDLKVRGSGDPGLDVAALSEAAHAVLRFYNRPVVFECKNAEAWNLHGVWKTPTKLAFLNDAFVQLRKIHQDGLPVVVLAKNNHPPIALYPASLAQGDTMEGANPLLIFNLAPGHKIICVLLDDFLKRLPVLHS